MVRSQAPKSFTIARLARAGGVGVETVRYYQRRGLLAVPQRSSVAKSGRGIRRYGEEDLRRLRFIRSAQTAGFTLAQIRELLSLDATRDRPRARRLAQAQLSVLDARIAALSSARNALRRLARSCCVGSSGPCPILQAFERQGFITRSVMP
ncbi:MAG TPA: MerR family transcriptional regulator [Steroidobacteraceae bacterium]|jgi:MerR family mercuric resistance operon transcriptional regulator|nr:MerR family transcriptional regulator [Steroidobacteraceae bacterium]